MIERSEKPWSVTPFEQRWKDRGADVYEWPLRPSLAPQSEDMIRALLNRPTFDQLWEQRITPFDWKDPNQFYKAPGRFMDPRKIQTG